MTSVPSVTYVVEELEAVVERLLREGATGAIIQLALSRTLGGIQEKHEGIAKRCGQ